MKKLISILSSIPLSITPVISVISCGVDNGQAVDAYVTDKNSGTRYDMYGDDYTDSGREYNFLNNVYPFALIPLWAINVSDASESGSGAKATQSVKDSALENQKDNLINSADGDIWADFFNQPERYDSYYKYIETETSLSVVAPLNEYGNTLSNSEYWINYDSTDSADDFDPENIDENAQKFKNTSVIVDSDTHIISNTLKTLNETYLMPFKVDKDSKPGDVQSTDKHREEKEDAELSYTQELSDVMVKLPPMTFTVEFDSEEVFTFNFTVSNITAHLKPTYYEMQYKDDDTKFFYWAWTFASFDFWSQDSLNSFVNDDYAFQSKINNDVYFTLADGGKREDWNKQRDDDSPNHNFGTKNYDENTEIIAQDIEIKIDPTSIKKL